MPGITTADFLRALYPEPLPEPGWLVIWTRHPSGLSKRSDWLRDAGAAAAVAARYRRTRDVHFGVALQDRERALEVARRSRPQAGPSSVRGSEASALAVPGAWLDLDVAGPSHRAMELPPDRDAALELLDAVPRPASIAVWTGGGFHLYWLLRQPWLLASEKDRRQAARFVRRVQWAVRSRARERGFKVDSTADLARLLRLPGTLNHKTRPPRPVEVVRASGRRYDPRDFAALADPPGPIASRSRRRSGRGLVPADEGPPAHFLPIWSGCSWIRRCYRERRRLPEPDWYAALSIVGRAAAPGLDGRRLAHRISRGYPGYTAAETAAKLRHALASAGARTCASIAHELGAWTEHCRRCPHYGRIRSPIVLGRLGSGSLRPAQRDPAAAAAGTSASGLSTPRT